MKTVQRIHTVSFLLFFIFLVGSLQADCRRTPGIGIVDSKARPCDLESGSVGDGNKHDSESVVVGGTSSKAHRFDLESESEGIGNKHDLEGVVLGDLYLNNKPSVHSPLSSFGPSIGHDLGALASPLGPNGDGSQSRNPSDEGIHDGGGEVDASLHPHVRADLSNGDDIGGHKQGDHSMELPTGNNLNITSEKRPVRPPPPPFGGFGPFGPSDPGSFPRGGPGFPGGPPPPQEAMAWASGYGNLKYFDAKHPFWHLPPFGSYGHFGGDPFLFPGGSGPGFPSGGFPGYPNGGFAGYPSGGVPGFPNVNLKYFDVKHPFWHPPPFGSYGPFGGDPFLFPGGSGPGLPSGGFTGYPNGGFPGFSGGGVPGFPGGNGVLEFPNVPPSRALTCANIGTYDNEVYCVTKHP